MHYERAKYWIHQFGPVGVLLGRYLRKNCASRTEVFMGIPVYYIQSQNDLSLGSSLLKDSASLLDATSPFWTKQVKKAFGSIMMQNCGSAFVYDLKERCLMVNPLRFTSPPFASTPWNRKVVMFTMEIIGALCIGILYRGRFGYFGVKNCSTICYKATARFLRKFNSDGDFSFQISCCYREIDKARPGRRYYERFMLDETDRIRRGTH